jgi:hypothetical protein
MTKVAVGCRTPEALTRRIAGRAAEGEVRVVTRMRPKRMAELVGGSLYWIVKHRMIACQTILRFDDRADGRIDIVCAAELQSIAPVPKRGHQGWRYLEGEGVPLPGDVDDSGIGTLPPLLYTRLNSLALL